MPTSPSRLAGTAGYPGGASSVTGRNGRPSARLELKTWMLEAEVIETLLCGCVTWATLKPHYSQLRTTHHPMLLRGTGSRGNPRTNHLVSYHDVLELPAARASRRQTGRSFRPAQGLLLPAHA